MRVLGVDPGSSATGFSVLDNSTGKIVPIVWGAIKPPRKFHHTAKLKFIYDNLTELISEHQPEAVSVEDIFMGVNIKSAIKLGQVRGCILVACANSGIEIAEYSPLEIKQSVVGYGRATKEQVQEMVMRLLNLKVRPTPFDVSDALAVALCHMNASKFMARVKHSLSKNK